MENTLYCRTYKAPPINEREILRYAGAPAPTPELRHLLDEVLSELQEGLTYRVSYRELPIRLEGDILHLGFTDTASNDLKRNLAGCESIVLFAATVGLAPDRLVARYGTRSPTKALLVQAIGAERIEALCDLFCREIAEEKATEGLVTRPRFRPRYGDLPLTLQERIVTVLDCPRKIGLTLNESLLLSPTKSVTAIVGVARK